MASTGPSQSIPAAEASAPQEITNGQSRQTTEPPLSSTPLEMTTLESKMEGAQEATANDAPSTTESSALQQKENEPTVSQAATTGISVQTPSHGKLDRTTSTAIGPSSDQPMPVAKDHETSGPILMITLLLTNGARHPFKLDSKYLHKRNVNVVDDDPFNLSIYTLKELILREWREGRSP